MHYIHFLYNKLKYDLVFASLINALNINTSVAADGSEIGEYTNSSFSTNILRRKYLILLQI